MQGASTSWTGLWPFGLSQPGQRAAPLTLGVSHWSCGDSHCACGASHQCSGRGIRPLRRAALRLPAFGASGPHTARWGTCTHARGISLVLRGDPFALCPCPLAWLSQCIRTNDPLRGALPPVCDLPQDRCAEHVSSSWGTGCTTPQHGVCHPIPRPHHCGTRPQFRGPVCLSVDSAKAEARSTCVGVWILGAESAAQILQTVAGFLGHEHGCQRFRRGHLVRVGERTASENHSSGASHRTACCRLAIQLAAVRVVAGAFGGTADAATENGR